MNPLVPAPDPAIRERRVAAALFFATCASTFFVYLWRWEPADAADGGFSALAFAAVLMAILLSHELGHYAVARHHRMRMSLPWFLPAPVLVGTLGAIIRLEDAPRTRTSLLEMGAAGPLAGLAVTVLAVVAWLVRGPSAPPGDVHLSTPLLWWLLSAVLLRTPPPPISTADPLGFAAWLGALLTAMNLVPLGQLDGGHVAGALFPKRTTAIGRVVTALLLLAGLAWPGWAVWVAVLHLTGTATPLEVRRDHTPPSPRARRVAVACLAAFLLCATPVPLSG